ncbi:shikimate dehydrogenase [Paludifilum halophilum]|uniref:Shikimate dehydrogenase (NADP(+)) n=1 Tax=Paludifilum halophilum TaxID=1642702 RepID=A0A235B5N9_9BACL|nr:shikimate dehydrogenase [Paludifilum halophilum]OYD07614.1 shikimate dehydrogenase [Paludifilum halophilum]
MEIDSETEKTGLIGHPIGHSKSPEMMNEAFRAKGLSYLYLACDVAPESLADAVQGMRALGFRGWNVTIPHKVAIMDLLDHVEESAREIGAVNTVVREGDRLIGTNTDGEGYIRSLLRETGLDPTSQRVLILGAGGAARAVGYALARAGVQEIIIANRTESKAERLASHLSRWALCRWARWTELGDTVRKATLLVQTTSVGMHPDIEAIPIDPSLLHAGMTVSDLVYHPRETKLLQEARARGAAVHFGAGMLLYQAALAFQRWTGREAPVEQMRRTLDRSLSPDSRPGEGSLRKKGIEGQP